MSQNKNRCIPTLLSNLKLSQCGLQNVTRKGYLPVRTVETRNLRVRPESERDESGETIRRNMNTSEVVSKTCNKKIRERLSPI